MNIHEHYKPVNWHHNYSATTLLTSNSLLYLVLWISGPVYQ